MKCSRHLARLAVSSRGVSQHMHTITELWKFGSIGRRICNRIMKEKHPCHVTLCAFRCTMKRFELKYFVIWRKDFTSFWKSTLLQREPFLTICYTINYSPLLVTSRLQLFCEKLPIVSSPFKAIYAARGSKCNPMGISAVLMLPGLKVKPLNCFPSLKNTYFSLPTEIGCEKGLCLE